MAALPHLAEPLYSVRVTAFSLLNSSISALRRYNVELALIWKASTQSAMTVGRLSVIARRIIFSSVVVVLWVMKNSKWKMRF